MPIPRPEKHLRVAPLFTSGANRFCGSPLAPDSRVTCANAYDAQREGNDEIVPVRLEYDAPGRPVDDDTATIERAESLSGAFRWLVLTALLNVLGLRSMLPRGSATVVSILTLTTLLAGTTPMQETHAADAAQNRTSLAHLSIGESRDTVITQVQSLWQSAPVCTLVKTGFGANKRMYFLETCSFVNAASLNVCAEPPATIEYRFFENVLVQVGFAFDQMPMIESLQACVDAAKGSETRPGSKPVVEIRLNGLQQLTVSDTVLASRIHKLKESL